MIELDEFWQLQEKILELRQQQATIMIEQAKKNVKYFKEIQETLEKERKSGQNSKDSELKAKAILDQIDLFQEQNRKFSEQFERDATGLFAAQEEIIAKFKRRKRILEEELKEEGKRKNEENDQK